MADEWIGIVTAAAPRYLKGASDLTIRKRLILAMMDRRGLIHKNVDGSYETRYDVDYKEPPVESFGDGGQINYQRRDYLKQAVMEWRGYQANDLMTLKERMEMKGEPVIVNRYNRIVPKLIKGVRNKLGAEVYIDGNLATNENRFCGLETFCGSGTTVVADLIAQPSDTYNTLSTLLNQSGRWSSGMAVPPNAAVATDWPEGEGSCDYDFNSPKLVNTVSTTWTGTNTWYANSSRIIRRTAQWLSNTVGTDGSSLMAMLSGDLLTGFKDGNETKLRVLTPHKESEDLGFSQVVNYEGVGLYTEFGIPAETGYVLNVDQMELMILHEDLIESKGPVWDPDSASWKFLVYCFGNFRWMPKYFAKFYPYAAS